MQIEICNDWKIACSIFHVTSQKIIEIYHCRFGTIRWKHVVQIYYQFRIWSGLHIIIPLIHVLFQTHNHAYYHVHICVHILKPVLWLKIYTTDSVPGSWAVVLLSSISTWKTHWNIRSPITFFFRGHWKCLTCSRTIVYYIYIVQS